MCVYCKLKVHHFISSSASISTAAQLAACFSLPQFTPAHFTCAALENAIAAVFRFTVGAIGTLIRLRVPTAANGAGGTDAGTDIAGPTTCRAGHGTGTGIEAWEEFVHIKQIVQYYMRFIFHIVQTLRRGGQWRPERQAQLGEVTAL